MTTETPARRTKHPAEKPSPRTLGRMMGVVRKDRIAQVIREKGFMSSADLAEMFGVSEMTVRRDLSDLEERGDLRRTHGGAILSETCPPEPAPAPFFSDRQRENAEAKARIARKALSLARPQEMVALDIGTTVLELARLMVGDPARRIFSNNLRVAALETRAEVYMLGGKMRPAAMSLVGPVTMEQAGKLWFDVAFLGVSSITEGGIFDFCIEDAEIKRVYTARASRCVVLADQSKFGVNALVQVAGLERIDTLVTDAAPTGALAEALRAADVEVIVAG
ncbi:DeoR/GlpR family DNA-binding transcription regulator [Salipiger sp. PrR002]|uniref:DeoR/GlpR family DNA-binding transcription regulator n=1 Tax=Salipiger sp. PrR002 TaxID=2706489 RepID=UPI0013BB3B59|nr:DeoR/GlpR family DNA-binding transcription regulator [Salipiger sp. PrR002]NDV99646.1 DeoR/GlpR transcriptional regulator [Salipiger sp. PrR002]NDW56756.1 DeoR/GlpR transcriptional regulator [Salipiger sp. PrR004]